MKSKGAYMLSTKNRRIIDLSLPLTDGGDFATPASIHYTDHQTRGQCLSQTHNIAIEDLGGRGNAIEEVNSLSTHCGTHFDSPWHYTSTVDRKKAMTVDEVPLEWCYGPGVKLDLQGKQPAEDISAADLQQAAQKVAYKIQPMDIVLIQTGVSVHYGQPDCELMNPGVTREATLWLADQGVKLVGIDSFCWDRPPRIMIAELKEGIKGKYMQGHRAAGERGMCILEWLTHLEWLPPFGFQICAFPVKVERASGSWVRAVAFVG
jgi:kynurenine formamidase